MQVTENVNKMKKLMAQYEAGKISLETLDVLMNQHIKIGKETDKVINCVVAIQKYGVKVRRDFHSFGLLTEGESISMGCDIENEAVRCPAKNDHTITRNTCLDYSGDAKHADECEGCPNFAITRSRLLGEEEG